MGQLGEIFQRFIAWWIRNAAYIGPLATTLSALAALLSVFMVTRTFKQARKDRQEELEANHPRFKISRAEVCRYSTHSGSEPKPHRLYLTLENINPNSARRIMVSGTIYHETNRDTFNQFKREPTDDIEKGESVDVEADFELSDEDLPYFLILTVEYIDNRTDKEHDQKHYRKFRLTGTNPTALAKVDKWELGRLGTAGTEHMKYVASLSS